jgi:hypothetical protein
LALAMVARPLPSPGLLLLADQGEEGAETGKKLWERMMEQIWEDAVALEKQTIQGTEITIGRDPRDDRLIAMTQRENTIIVTNDLDILRDVLWRWNGRPEEERPVVEEYVDEFDQEPEPDRRSLAENEHFQAIAQQARRPQDPPPNVVFYADPLGLARQFGRQAWLFRIALAFAPQLGIDGIQGIGGAYTTSTAQFDNLFHVHLLLENPRAGVLTMVRFDTKETRPQPWVPQEVSRYLTGAWQFEPFYERLRMVVDQLRGDGALDEYVGNYFDGQLGIDFQTQVLPNLAGRVTLISAYDKPARFQQGQQRVLAIEVNDEAAAAETLKRLVQRQPGTFIEKQTGPVKYYSIAVPQFEQFPEEYRPVPPFVAVMDKHLFVGSSHKLFEQIVAARERVGKRLADSDEYRRFADSLSQETAGTKPAALMITQTAQTWRHLYEALRSEETRERLAGNGGDNPVAQRIAGILRDDLLPPFEVFEKYLGPGGGILYDTNNGFHLIHFTLRGE